MSKLVDVKALFAALEQNQTLLREIGLRYGVSTGNLAIQSRLDSVRSINCPDDVVEFYGKEMGDYIQEHLRVIILNTRNEILDDVTVYVGNVNCSVVRPAEVFRPAIIANAPAIIVCHNHPSGDPQPSGADVKITQDLIDAGKILGIELLDHVVIGAYPRAVSMKEARLGFV